MPIRQITPEEAYRLMQAGCPYIDVRTEGEFAAGHPENAVNIPVVYPDPGAGGMKANDDFLDVIAAHFPKDRPLIVGCQMGGRSQRAAEMLAQAGYAEISNVQGGFGGVRDATGRIVAKGWAQCGLPVSTACDEGNSYAALKARAASRSG